MTNSQKNLRVLIAAEHASAKFGGEAVLPLHYYRVLRKRNIPVWLVVHERTKQELLKLYPDDENCIRFVPDTNLHRFLWKIGTYLPDRIGYFTVGFLMRFASQIIQRHIIKKLIKEVGINVIHQPMPVSPKEPSLLFNLGVPVIIGPMNGGMDYPPAFRRMQGKVESQIMRFARGFSSLLNILIPGKKRATLLLVANERTKNALPSCLRIVKTETLVENGVDLELWKNTPEVKRINNIDRSIHFVYMGRLVDWKAVDILIDAFILASKNSNIHLSIIGDGAKRAELEQQARDSNVFGQHGQAGKVNFVGWKSQEECASLMHSADALVLTSLMECGGAVVLEAMAMGLAVVATNWGGPADYIDSASGILVDPKDRMSFVSDVATAMKKLAHNSDMRRDMGLAGRLKVEKEFNWDIKVDRMIDIYTREVTFE